MGELIVLDPPTDTSVDVFDTCVAGMQVSADQARIRGYRHEIGPAEANFIAAANSSSLRLMAIDDLPNQLKIDMMWLYDVRFVGSKAGRDIYDDLVARSRGLCPFCNISSPTTLDHCLPKAKFPRLAVTPLNLAPVCRDCNMEKKAGFGPGNLSPYFDRWVTSGVWLTADMPDPHHPEILRFRVLQPSWMSDDQHEALRGLFKSADMDNRFAAQAENEFHSCGRFHDRFARAGVDELEREFADREDTARRHRANGWKAATYKAWLANVRAVGW